MPHGAVMWDAGESWELAALSSAPQEYLLWLGLSGLASSPPFIISSSYVANRKHVFARTAGSGDCVCACHELTESAIVPLSHNIVFNCLMCGDDAL